MQNWASQQLFTGTHTAFTLVVVLLCSWILRLLSQGPEERPREYTVPPPKLPEKYSTVENTNLKVAGGTAIQCYAPATGQFLGFINPSTPASIDRSLALASDAQPKWAATTFRERRAVLTSLLQYILAHQQEICTVASLDSGKTAVDATLGEVLVTAERIRWTLANGENALRSSRRPRGPLIMLHKRGEVRYEPLGVVAALVSWNYPFHNVVGPMISGLFAGNAVVVKVSERTSWSAVHYLNIVRGALQAHGHDPNLVQTVVCWPATAAHLTSHPLVSHVTFIGSRPVGHQVAAAAAKSLTPVVMELGGKDPAIVLDSVGRDLSRVVEILLRGTFQASGQNCIGIERILVGPKVYDKLIGLLEPRVKALRLGPEADMGAMVSDERFEQLEHLIQDAVAKGAKLLVGGKRYKHPEYPMGHYFSPTLIVDVTSDMAITREEAFAPIMALARLPDAYTATQVVSLANAPGFGLGASIFGSERDPSLPEIVSGIRAGNVAVNDFAAFYAMQLPFGGVSGSGYGRFAGEEGLKGLCNAKSVCIDRWWWMGARTAIPRPVQYPVPHPSNGGQSWQFTAAVVLFGYGLGVTQKARALWEMVKQM